MTLEQLQAKFPPQTERALTGRIPMEFVKNNEAEIRKLIRDSGLRMIYRGPRTGDRCTPTDTLKKDAVAGVIY